MTRRALGKGLSALIREPDSPLTPESSPGETSIPTELIDPNPFQPRASFAEAELQELATSVRAKGVIQPVLVRRAGDRYQLVAGERRWRAARLAGLDSVPALVRVLDDREALELALTENLLRHDLGPLETARAYRSLQDRFGASQEEIAARLGVNRVTVTNTLRLLRLPKAVQELIDTGKLSAGHARALLSIQGDGEQLRMAERIVKLGLSVREAERAASVLSKPKPVTDDPPPKVDPNLRAAAAELESRFGTRVRITGDGHRGTLEICYFSSDDLTRLYEMMIH